MHNHEMRLVETHEMSLRGAMMIIGFPTHGLVGSIASSYLVHAMGMSIIGHIDSDALPPTVIMEEGLVQSPIRLYASKVVCGPDRQCDQLVVVLSDIQPPTEILNQLGNTLLDWAEAKSLHDVVLLEGQPVETVSPPTDIRVVAMANRAAEPLLRQYRFSRASGVITGFAGGVMRAALDRPLPTLCLVSQAQKDFPDARAAAQILRTINPLVPMLVIDTQPLLDRAQKIEKEVRQNLQQQHASLSSLKRWETEGPGEMYR